MKYRTLMLLSICGAIYSLPTFGCGPRPPSRPQVHPVSGKVLYRGQPAKGLRVTFNALGDQGKLRFAPAAITDDKGEFQLHSYGTNDGAPLGEYAVTFQWPDHINNGMESDPLPEVDRLRNSYGDPKKSRFKVSVHEGQNAVEPFVLQ